MTVPAFLFYLFAAIAVLSALSMVLQIRNTVAAAMRELGIRSRVRKRFRPTTTQTDPSKQPAENKLDQNFTADEPNQKWVTEIV